MIKQKFQTSDLPLTAYLSYLGFPFEVVDFSNPKKVVFAFEKTAMLMKEVEKFYSRMASVEPLGFFYSLRSVKASIYNLDKHKKIKNVEVSF